MTWESGHILALVSERNSTKILEDLIAKYLLSSPPFPVPSQ